MRSKRSKFTALAICGLFAALCAITAVLDTDTGGVGPCVAIVVAGVPSAELLKKRKKCIEDARAIVTNAKSDERDMTAEEQQTFDTLMTDAEAYKTEVDKREADRTAAENRERQLAEHEEDIGRLQNHGFDLNNVRGSAAGRDAGGLPTLEDHATAVQGWFAAQANRSDVCVTDEQQAAARRCGMNLLAHDLILNLDTDPETFRMRAQQRRIARALSTTTGADGGVLVGSDFATRLEEAMLWYGPMLQTSEILRTADGRPMPWGTMNDTGTEGRQLGEEKAVAASTIPFEKSVWQAYKFTSDEILVSYELLRDNAVNLVNRISQSLGMRLGRAVNTKATTGSGAATLFGIVNEAVVGKTAAATNAITFPELKALFYSVDQAYRDQPGVGWMMHNEIIRIIASIVDGDGKFLWEPSVQVGTPDILEGKPVMANNAMASTLAANAEPVIFGDLSAYKIRQVGQVRMYRLQERHRENDQDAFLGFTEVDGKLLDAGTNPVKKMKMAAS